MFSALHALPAIACMNSFITEAEKELFAPTASITDPGQQHQQKVSERTLAPNNTSTYIAVCGTYVYGIYHFIAVILAVLNC
jgi:hypothetical protein